MADVFISYKSDEINEANWVREFLTDNGITCWMAPASIEGGTSYAMAIPKAIQECRAFVLILSRAAQESAWVPKEIDQAINHRKRILPFMIEDFVLAPDFGFYLSNVQCYRAFENKTASAKQMLLTIKCLLDAPTDKVASEAKPEVKAKIAPAPVHEQEEEKPKYLSFLSNCKSTLKSLGENIGEYINKDMFSVSSSENKGSELSYIDTKLTGAWDFFTGTRKIRLIFAESGWLTVEAYDRYGRVIESEYVRYLIPSHGTVTVEGKGQLTFDGFSFKYKDAPYSVLDDTLSVYFNGERHKLSKAEEQSND